MAAKEAWQNSLAKETLEHSLVEGTIPLDAKEMEPEEVYNLVGHPEFREWEFDLFSRNLKNARKRIREKKQIATDDSASLAQDLLNNPRKKHNHRGEPRWEGSAAEKTLKEDVGALFQVLGGNLCAADVETDKPVYQEFLHNTVRKHIHQEVTAIKFGNYLEDKKIKAVEEKKAKREKAAEQRAAAEAKAAAQLAKQKEKLEKEKAKREKAAAKEKEKKEKAAVKAAKAAEKEKEKREKEAAKTLKKKQRSKN